MPSYLGEEQNRSEKKERTSNENYKRVEKEKTKEV